MLNKRLKYYGFILCVLFLVYQGRSAYGAETSFMAVEDVRQASSAVAVNVTLNHFSNIASGYFSFHEPNAENSYVLKDINFEKAGFSGSYFKRDGSIEVRFISRGGGNRSGDRETLCTLFFEVNEEADMGSKMNIEVKSSGFFDEKGSEISMITYDGSIEKNYMLGDLEGNDRLTPVSAQKMIQYTMGKMQNLDPFAKLSGDLTASGNIGLRDAQLLLDFLVGKIKSFFTIQTDSALPVVLLGSEYNVMLETSYGKGPFEWTIPRGGGTLPRGLVLDAKSGVIHGTVTSKREIGEKKCEIVVRDRYGNSYQRQFTFQVVDLNLKKIEPISPVSVNVNEQPNFPKFVEVVYKDGTKGTMGVVWPKVNTSALGRQTIRGELPDIGATVNIEVVVIQQSYLLEKKIEYYQFLNIHAILLKVSQEVFGIKLNDMEMYYEGDNWFGRNTSVLKAGTQVDVVLYDRYGNVLEKTQITVEKT